MLTELYLRYIVDVVEINLSELAVVPQDPLESFIHNGGVSVGAGVSRWRGRRATNRLRPLWFQHHLGLSLRGWSHRILAGLCFEFIVFFHLSILVFLFLLFCLSLLLFIFFFFFLLLLCFVIPFQLFFVFSILFILFSTGLLCPTLLLTLFILFLCTCRS